MEQKEISTAMNQDHPDSSAEPKNQDQNKSRSPRFASSPRQTPPKKPRIRRRDPVSKPRIRRRNPVSKPNIRRATVFNGDIYMPEHHSAYTLGNLIAKAGIKSEKSDILQSTSFGQFTVQKKNGVLSIVKKGAKHTSTRKVRSPIQKVKKYFTGKAGIQIPRIQVKQMPPGFTAGISDGLDVTREFNARMSELIRALETGTFVLDEGCSVFLCSKSLTDHENYDVFFKITGLPLATVDESNQNFIQIEGVQSMHQKEADIMLHRALDDLEVNNFRSIIGEHGTPSVRDHKYERLPEEVFWMDKLCCLRRFFIYLYLAKWYNFCLHAALALNVIALCLYDPLDALDGDRSIKEKILDVLDIVFPIIFSVEIVVKVTAIGLIQRYSLLRNWWHVFDAAIVLVCWLPIVMDALKMESVPSLTALRTLRVMVIFRTVDSTKVVFRALLLSLPLLGSVLLLLGFFLLLFGISGVQLFKGALRHRCFEPEGYYGNATSLDLETSMQYNWKMTDPAKFCSPFAHEFPYFGVGCKGPEVCMFWNYYNCAQHNRTEYCELNEQPNNDFTGFDNIITALIAMCTSVSLEGWADICYLCADTVGSPIAYIYFGLLVVMMAMFAYNLVVAVVVESYIHTSELAQRGEMNDFEDELDPFLLKHSQRMETERSLLNISKTRQAADAKIRKRVQTFADIIKLGEEREEHRRNEHEELLKQKEEVKKDNRLYGKGCRKKCLLCRDKVRLMVDNPVFHWVINGLIWVNALVLALHFYDNAIHGFHKTLDHVLEGLNVFFTFVFTIEIALVMTAYGPKEYFSQKFNIFDFLIVVLSLLELVLNTLYVGVGGEDAYFEFITVLRTFRITRVFRLAKRMEGLRQILRTLQSSIGAITSFLTLMMLVILVFALVGMSLFGGGYRDVERYVNATPRNNFDTFHWSLLTVFQVVSGENWNDVLYQIMTIRPIVGAIYMIFMYVFCNWCCLNLFLAILLERFGAEETEKQSTQKPKGKKGSKDKVKQSDSDASDDSNAISPPSATAARMRQPRPSVKFNSVFKTIANEMVYDLLSRQDDFSGRQAVDHFFKYGYVETEEEAVLLGIKLQQRALLASCNRFYKFSGSHLKRFTIIMNADQGQSKTVRGKQLRKTLSIKPNAVQKKQPRKSQMEMDGFGLIRHAYSDDARQNQKDEKANRKFQNALRQRALFFFAKDNSCRKKIANIVFRTVWFEAVIIVTIIISCVTSAFQSSDFEAEFTSSWHLTFLIIDVVLTAVFALEAILRILASGFVCTKHAYLRSPWNVLDFTIVLISIVDVFIEFAVPDQIDIGFFKGLRALRSLRALRFINKNYNLKMVINILLLTMRKVGNVVLVFLLFTFIFGIIGVQFFAGKLWHCQGAEGDELLLDFDNCTGNWTDIYTGETASRRWVNSDNNFDNIVEAMITLVEMTTFEMWPDLMFKACDITGIRSAPARDEYIHIAAPYFLSWVFVGGFFLSELFVGIVCDNFRVIEEKMKGSALLTDGQRKWVSMQLMAIETSPAYQPSNRAAAWTLRYEHDHKGSSKGGHRPCLYMLNKFKAKTFKIVTSTAFEIFIMVCVAINTLLLCLNHWYPQYQAPDTPGGKEAAPYAQFYMHSFMEVLLHYSNTTFMLIFLFEALFKIFALEIKQYFRFGWNCFDITIVVISLITFFTDLIAAKPLPVFTVLRFLRVLRVFKMFKLSRGLKNLSNTLILSLPALFNIGIIFLLFIFVFAVLGMNLFSDCPYGKHLNEHANFENFFNAFTTLFRCATGESWNGIMHDCRRCSSFGHQRPIPEAFFIIFFFLIGLMVLSLMIGVIIGNFSKAMEADRTDGLAPKHLIAFSAAWGSLCKEGELYLPVELLPKLLLLLPVPLGFKNANTLSGMKKLTENSNLVRDRVEQLHLHVHTSDMIPKRYLRRLKKTIAKRRKCDPDKVHAVFAVFYIEALVGILMHMHRRLHGKVPKLPLNAQFTQDMIAKLRDTFPAVKQVSYKKTLSVADQLRARDVIRRAVRRAVIRFRFRRAARIALAAKQEKDSKNSNETKTERGGKTGGDSKDDLMVAEV